MISKKVLNINDAKILYGVKEHADKAREFTAKFERARFFDDWEKLNRHVTI